MKACKECHFLVEEGDECPRCGGQLSKEWQGFVVILDWEKSEIAKRLSITSNVKYALKVR